MKESTWNVLTIALLILWLIAVIVMAIIFTNPGSSINPLRYPTLPPTVEIPTSTATLRPFPSTWTPTVTKEMQVSTMTMLPSSTNFTLPTFTPTPTSTRTPTRTPTRTRTPTSTPAE